MKMTTEPLMGLDRNLVYTEPVISSRNARLSTSAFFFPMPDSSSSALPNSPHNHIDVFLRRLAFVPSLLRYIHTQVHIYITVYRCNIMHTIALLNFT